MFHLFDQYTNILPGNNEITTTNLNLLIGNLWISDYHTALNINFIKKNNISVIINCTPDIPFIYDIIDPHLHKIHSIESYRIPVYDSLLSHDIFLMETYFPKVLPFLVTKLIKEKKNILIHCVKGRQRSAILIAALLYILVDNKILKFNHNNNESNINNIIKYILHLRPRAFRLGYSINFKKALENFFKVKITI